MKPLSKTQQGITVGILVLFLLIFYVSGGVDVSHLI